MVQREPAIDGRSLDAAARSLIQSADQPLRDRVRHFRARCPRIARQVRQDRGVSGPFHFWGRSRNIDELTQTVIVPPAVLEVLGCIASFKSLSFVTPHAGLQHTYGYLFSLIDTPYGRKRDRWTERSLEQAFDLPPSTLGPCPESGTLLANATWMAGQIAFRKTRRLAWLNRCLRKRVAPTLLEVAWNTLKVGRLVETVDLRPHTGRTDQLRLVTDLVKLPAARKLQLAAPYLLIYSLHDSRQSHPQLITLFTVSAASRAGLLARGRSPRRSDIRPRYNAFVPGLPDEVLRGSCHVERFGS